MTGTAFIYQPTFGDNPVARKRESAQQQGDWWIGGSENRPSENDPKGKQHPDGPDQPRGTLTSPCFRIVGRDISFLIGGGCTTSNIRAELIVDNQVRLFTWDHYVSFDSYEAAWVDLSKYQRFGLSKLRNYFELRDIHEIRMVYNELFTRKKIY